MDAFEEVDVIISSNVESGVNDDDTSFECEMELLIGDVDNEEEVEEEEEEFRFPI